MASMMQASRKSIDLQGDWADALLARWKADRPNLHLAEQTSNEILLAVNGKMKPETVVRNYERRIKNPKPFEHVI
jgi:hypothetical protein